MKSVAAIATVASLAGLAVYQTSESTQLFQVDVEAKSAFDNYVAEYDKSYGTKEEYEFRLNIFAKNFKMIADHNTANGDSAEVLGVNHMSDWSSSEYKKLLGYKSQEL